MVPLAVRASHASGKLTQVWGGQTLVHRDALPFSKMQHLPDVYTQFRQKVENAGARDAAVAAYRPEPPVFKPSPTASGNIDPGRIPAAPAVPDDPRSAVPFKGGETAGLARVHDYFRTKLDLPRTYKDTRNQMLGPDYSTKFSLWLATGSISGRRIIHELQRYEAEVESNKSTYWIWFELLWRDFFRFQAVKQGTKMFQLAGPRDVTNKPWKRDEALLQAWKDGRTGYGNLATSTSFRAHFLAHVSALKPARTIIYSRATG